MNPFKRLKLTIEIVATLASLKSDGPNKLRRLLKSTALENSEFLLSVWTVAAQKNIAVPQVLNAINWVEETLEEESPEADISKLLCLKAYLGGLYSFQFGEAHYQELVDSVISSKHVPEDPNLRACILGSLSMGYALSGDFERTYEYMRKALENNPAQLEVERKNLPVIESEGVRRSWEKHVQIMMRVLAKRPSLLL